MLLYLLLCQESRSTTLYTTCKNNSFPTFLGKFLTGNIYTTLTVVRLMHGTM
jgi:hypothetical protein